MTTDSEVAMRRASLLPAALIAALIGACDGGAPAEPNPAAPVVVTSVDTLHPGQIARVRGSGLSRASSPTTT